MLKELTGRHGKASGTRQMIQIVGLVKQYGHARLQNAVEEALSTGCSDPAAIRHLLSASELARQRPENIELPTALVRFERSLPVMNQYDQLLSAGGSR